MKELSTEILKVAYRKLLTATYFDKTDMVMRHHVALFAKRLTNVEDEESEFVKLLAVAKGKNEELLNDWLDKMKLTFYPKKVSGQEEQNDSHLITNLPPKALNDDKSRYTSGIVHT